MLPSFFKLANTPSKDLIVEKPQIVLTAVHQTFNGNGRPNYCSKKGAWDTKVMQTLFHLNPKFNDTPFYGHTPLDFMTKFSMVGNLVSVDVITVVWLHHSCLAVKAIGLVK